MAEIFTSALVPMRSLQITSCRETTILMDVPRGVNVNYIPDNRLGMPRSTLKMNRSMRLRATHEKASEFIKDLKDGITGESTMEASTVAKEMLQTDKIGSRGEIYVAAQFLFIVLVLLPPVDLKPVSQVIGVGAVLTGLAIIVAGSNALGKNLTPLPVPRDNATLSTDGMYKWMRHPLYTGLMLASTGIAAVTQDSTRALFAVGLIVVLSLKAGFEEDQLIDKFGEKYEQYMKETKRFWFF